MNQQKDTQDAAPHVRHSMQLLLGICGKEAPEYIDFCRNRFEKCEILADNKIIINSNLGRVSYPDGTLTNHRRMYLNGICVLKNHPLDEYVAEPARLLTDIASKNISEIPKQFVNGAYNGVIFDEDVTYIFNDFMALFPLYFSVRNKTLFFSTSLVVLNRILKPSWDFSAISEFLQLGYNYSFRTLLKNISCLPPASLLSFKNGELRIVNHTSFPSSSEVIAPQSDVVDNIRSSFNKAVNRVYSPNLKYTLSLTGGMDSRLIFLEWPDRHTLMTETAGIGTSDYIKASDLVTRYGNVLLHQLENKRDDLYVDGIIKYYDLCDNPTKLLAHYNLHHLLWKQQRGADIHLSGIGGELADGESLYLSRRGGNVFREAIAPYVYHPLTTESKSLLMGNVLHAQYRSRLADFSNVGSSINRDDLMSVITEKLDNFIGSPSFKETFVERFRTFMLANAAFYPLSFAGPADFQLFPFNDREFIYNVTRYHPRTRELRRLTIAILNKYQIAREIPIDTTHLRVHYPYALHKFFRVFRMVLNIGFHRRVPFLQKGDPPKFRKFKYFDHAMKEFRGYVKATILKCTLYDQNMVREYLSEVDRITSSNYYTMHGDAMNISILLRLAIAEQKFRA